MLRTVTPEQDQLLQNLVDNDLNYISSMIEIPDKKQKRRKFVPWPVQRQLIEGLTGRDIVIKDAQIGCTSILTAVFGKHTWTTPDTTTVIMAHEEFLTKRLLHRVQVFYDSIPKWMKPLMDHSGASEKRFPKLNSVMYIITAQSQVAGRGEPIHRLLISEEAFYVEGAFQKIVLPALQRVPENGWVVRESTPNGEEGSFHDEVQKTLRNESTFKLHCLWWWLNPDNVLSSESTRSEQLNIEEFEYNDDERTLARIHSLSKDQIRWRRWKLAELDAMFYQEHLESLDTCFLVVGEPHYAPGLTMGMSKQCRPGDKVYIDGEEVEVWFKPEAGGHYIMGIDPGQARQTASVAQVWRFDGGHPQHCATMAGYIEPKPMARKCAALGRWYGNALAVPEANAHGLALVGDMLKKYPRIYYRRDLIRGVSSLQPGWMTTPKTKPYMMQELTAQLPHIETYDAEFVRQIRGFRNLGMGKVGTVSADDYHDAGCLALVGAVGSEIGQRDGYRGSSGWTW